MKPGRPLRIVLCLAEGECGNAEWLAAAQGALPAAQVWLRDPRAPAAAQAPQADFAIVGPPRSHALFTEQRALRAVFTLTAGVNTLLAMPQMPADVPLVRLEDAGMAAAMADYALGAALRFALRLDQYQAQQRQARWLELPTRSPAEVTTGVLGLGAIGAPIAQRLAGAGFTVRGYARSRKAIPGVTCFAQNMGGLDGFLDRLDLLVSVLPLTPATDGLLNRDRLQRLAHGGHLVNIGRGGHLVEADLLALLDSGHLSGATLDVVAQEPLPPEHAFWCHPRITLTPHISGPTQRAPALAQIAQKIARIERGESIAGIVDRRRGY